MSNPNLSSGIKVVNFFLIIKRLKSFGYVYNVKCSIEEAKKKSNNIFVGKTDRFTACEMMIDEEDKER
jgi:hypothetical protein